MIFSRVDYLYVVDGVSFLAELAHGRFGNVLRYEVGDALCRWSFLDEVNDRFVEFDYFLLTAFLP